MAKKRVAKTKKWDLAEKLRQRADPGINTHPHGAVGALAGCGKTTTMIGGVNRLKGNEVALTPSAQQAAVWDALGKSLSTESVCVTSFSNAIVDELKARVPAGCNAQGIHSMGNGAIQRALGKMDLRKFRVREFTADVMGREMFWVRTHKPVVLKAVDELVGLCKQNLVEPEPENLETLAAHYEVDLNGNATEVFGIVPQVLDKCKTELNGIDFNDMLWLPLVLDLPVYKYDNLLIDEVQDLNRSQQELCYRIGRRLFVVGDPHQAIYGFAGADAESMKRMRDTLGSSDRGCEDYPLTITRRCAKAIVREANRYVPEFEAYHENPIGNVRDGKAATYSKEVEDGDFVLCRINAPLVSQCFRFLKEGRKANIQGRKIGAGLITLIEKFKQPKVANLLANLDDWHKQEVDKEYAKRNPSDTVIQGLDDKYGCLVAFCQDLGETTEVVKRIEAIFTDDKLSPGIKLSSIHKSKGLESQRVWWLQLRGTQLKAKSERQAKQERNLAYVATTRAINELVYVTD